MKHGPFSLSAPIYACISNDRVPTDDCFFQTSSDTYERASSWPAIEPYGEGCMMGILS